jgi:hypothetical protein
MYRVLFEKSLPRINKKENTFLTRGILLDVFLLIKNGKTRIVMLTYPQPARPNGSQPPTPPTHWPREERTESMNVMCSEKVVGRNAVKRLKPLKKP